MTLLHALVVATLSQSVAPQTHDSTYATPRVAELVARAAEANRHLPARLTSYSAHVETEISLLLFSPDGPETVAQTEQIASNIYWRSDGGLTQQLIGYRSQSSILVLPSNVPEMPWVTPTLYGDRLTLYGLSAPRSPGPLSPEGKHMVHPFSAARDSFYRFSGGDTVQIIHLAKRDVPLIQIHVVPRSKIEVASALFTGDIYLDATRMQIVQMRGRTVLAGPDPPFNDNVLQGNIFVDFVSAEHDSAFWLPHEQRWELQLAFVLFSESRAVVRVISRFTDVRANDSTVAWLAAPPDSFPYGRIVVADNLRDPSTFTDWIAPLGAVTAQAGTRDFDQYATHGIASDEPPRLSFGARYLSQLLRYNQVEGLYTGLGLKYDFGVAVPGLQLRGYGGWAWREHVVRGGVALAERHAGWEFSAQAARQIAATPDLSSAASAEPDAPPLLGDDRFFDRRLAGLLIRTTKSRGLAWRFEVGRAADRVAGRNAIPFGPLLPGEAPGPPAPAGDSALSRAVFPGKYWLVRAQVVLNPSAGGFSLDRGLQVRLAYESASGDLEWRRYEAGTSWRRRVGRWTFSAGGNAGALTSRAPPPPQALYQLRRVTDYFSAPDSVPFTGDRGATARTGLMYTLPIFNEPVMFLRFRLPGPAPSPFVGVESGWTDASAQTLALMNRFGWRTSDGGRSALELSVRFFGGGIGLGVIRPLDSVGKWRFGLRGSIGQ